MGKHGIGGANKIGKLFTEFCASNGLATEGTLFPNRKCHKIFLVSPDHKAQNLIDNFAINGKDLC